MESADRLFKLGLTPKHFINVVSLGAPLLVGLIAEFFMYTADSAMVGRLGTDHLAAIAIATMFAELLWVIVWHFAPGTQALAARRFGRQEHTGGEIRHGLAGKGLFSLGEKAGRRSCHRSHQFCLSAAG